MRMKGSMLDLPIIMALLLGGALSIFIVYLILINFQAAWPVAGVSADNLSTAMSGFRTFDYMFILFAVGLSGFSIMSAFFIRSHPIFFVFSAIFLLPLSILLSAQATNVFDAVATTEPFVPVSNAFPYIFMFMHNLPSFCLITGLLIAIALYAKPVGEV